MWIFREFSGWALSHNDWEEKLQELANDIREREDVDTSGTFYTIGYSSPWVMEESERRNEIWIEKTLTAQRFTSPASNFGNAELQTSDDLTELLTPKFIERGIVRLQIVFLREAQT